jgi:predicted esterase
MPDLSRLLAIRLICLFIFYTSLVLCGEETPLAPADKMPKKGDIEMTIQCRMFDTPDGYLNSPLIKSFMASNNKSPADQLKYKIEEQKMCMFVPESYDGGDGWGLFVYTSPNQSGNIPGHYRDVMAKHKLIYVAPHDADNNKPYFLRLGLTLDAFATARSIYNIEPERVYAAGFSGGGTIATTEAVYYPDIFHGLLNFSSQYFLLKSPSSVEGYVYNREWKASDTHDLAKYGHRFAFNTGNNDKNYKEVKAAVSAWKEINLDAELFEQSGLGHQLPNAEYLDKMLCWIQEPQDIAAEKSLKEALAKKNYPIALQMLESIKAMPSWKPQAKLFDTTVVELDKFASAEAEKILAAGNTVNLAAARDFVRKWKICPSSKKVVDLCELQASKLADDMLAQHNCTPVAMRKFLADWDGFACREKVAVSYTKAGDAMWTNLQAQKAGIDKILEFIGQFKGFPCTDQAIKEITPKADEAWAKLSVKPKISPAEIRGFIKKWNGLGAAVKAQAALNQLAETEYGKIGSGKKRKSQLQRFINQFADTPAGQRAKKETDR